MIGSTGYGDWTKLRVLTGYSIHDNYGWRWVFLWLMCKSLEFTEKSSPSLYYTFYLTPVSVSIQFCDVLRYSLSTTPHTIFPYLLTLPQPQVDLPTHTPSTPSQPRLRRLKVTHPMTAPLLGPLFPFPLSGEEKVGVCVWTSSPTLWDG